MAFYCPKCNKKLPFQSGKTPAINEVFYCITCEAKLILVPQEKSPLRHVFWILPPFMDALWGFIFGFPFDEDMYVEYADPNEAPRDRSKIEFERKIENLKGSDDAASQYKVGHAYLHGDGVQQNEGEALKWFMKAAEQGYADAQSMAGRMYFMGEGTERNYDEAYFWYTLAAKSGKPQEWPYSVARYLTEEKTDLVQKRVSEWTPKKSS